MKVEKIEWISRAGQEAEVQLSSDGLVCVAFCQPCEYEEGASLEEPLHAFMVKNVVLTVEENTSLTRVSRSSFAYKIVAKVLDPKQALVSIDGFKVELDERIPAGVNSGDFIGFECSRLDLW